MLRTSATSVRLSSGSRTGPTADGEDATPAEAKLQALLNPLNEKTGLEGEVDLRTPPARP